MRRLRSHLERSEFKEALRLAQELRAEVPENRDVLYMAAVSQRYLKLIPDALATLAELEKHHPGYSRLFQERGHCYVAMKDAPQAIHAFLAANGC